MKIKVKGFLTFGEVMGRQGDLELEFSQVTIRQLLLHLSEIFGKGFQEMIYDPNDKTGKLISMVLVNGHNHRNLQDRLDHELKDGDNVDLFPPMAGG
ncbi:MAG: MoaD family protein [SAR324 cluster bacterium]|nr:MoaD family protein [SAR324 cluster bacterium]